MYESLKEKKKRSLTIFPCYFIRKYKAFKSNRIHIRVIFILFLKTISLKPGEEKGRSLYDNIKYFTSFKVVLTSKEEKKRLLIPTREARF